MIYLIYSKLSNLILKNKYFYLKINYFQILNRLILIIWEINRIINYINKNIYNNFYQK